MNYQRWNEQVFCINSMSEFEKKDSYIDGIYAVKFSHSYIDILLKGVEGHENGKHILVCFTAAVSDRETKSGPFFSGLEISKQMNIPLISVADPLVTENQGLGLAWYAGSENIPDLRENIQNILNHLSRHFSRDLILIGGSGGGFAVMNIIQGLKCSARAFVWNPQINISNYFSGFVSNYLNHSFPSLTQEYRNVKNSNRIKDIMGLLPVRSDLSSIDFQHEVIYIQNESDTLHVTKHAAELMKYGQWRRTGYKSFYSVERAVNIWFGGWGEGHASPPISLIKHVISSMEEGLSSTNIICDLESNYKGGSQYFYSISIDGHPAKFEVDLVKVDLIVNVSVSVDSFLGFEEFAFYLLKNGRKIKYKWYGAESYTSFDLADCGIENISITIFIKDRLGQVMIKEIDLCD